MTTEKEIFDCKSPKDKVDGPYAIVHISEEEWAWVVVALDWVKNPKLAIRWFNDGSDWHKGYPIAHCPKCNDKAPATPLWVNLPETFYETCLQFADPNKAADIKQFLAKKMTGTELKAKHGA